MKNCYMTYTKLVKAEVPLLRKPTPEELKMIKDGNMFDIDDLFDWDKDEILNEDHSDSEIEVIWNDKYILLTLGVEYGSIIQM